MRMIYMYGHIYFQETCVLRFSTINCRGIALCCSIFKVMGMAIIEQFGKHCKFYFKRDILYKHVYCYICEKLIIITDARIGIMQFVLVTEIFFKYLANYPCQMFNKSYLIGGYSSKF